MEIKRFLTTEGIPELPENELIAAENLNMLDQRQAGLFESRMAMIRELGREIGKTENAGFDIIRDKYKASLPYDGEPSDYAFSPSPEELLHYFDSISAVEKIGLCRAISDSFQNSRFLSTLLGWPDDSCKADAVGRIAYLKNAYTDNAFLRFSKVVVSPRSEYCSSFRAVCQEVYDGQCEYCILPVETSGDGLLMSFYSLMDQFSLKIVSLCTLEQTGTGRFTNYALLKKEISLAYLRSKSLVSSKDSRFEIKLSIPREDSLGLCHFLQYAALCGMTVQRIATAPHISGEQRISYYIAFGIYKADLATFLTYLALETPHYLLMGAYATVL